MTNWYEHENVTPEWIEAMKTSNRIANDWEPWEWEVMEKAVSVGEVVHPESQGPGRGKHVRNRPKAGNFFGSSCYRIAESFELPKPKKDVLKFYEIVKFVRNTSVVRFLQDNLETDEILTDGNDMRFIGYCHNDDLGRISSSRLLYQDTQGATRFGTVLTEEIEKALWATHVAIIEEVEE